MNLSFTQEYPWGGATNFQAKVMSHYEIEPYYGLFLPKKHSFRADPTERWEQGKKIHFHHGGRKLKYNCWYIGVCTGVQPVKIMYQKAVLKDFVVPQVLIGSKLLDFPRCKN